MFYFKSEMVTVYTCRVQQSHLRLTLTDHRGVPTTPRVFLHRLQLRHFLHPWSDILHCPLVFTHSLTHLLNRHSKSCRWFSGAGVIIDCAHGLVMRRWDASSYAQQRGHRAAAGIDGVRGAMVVIGMRGDGGMYVCILVVCMCVCMYVCMYSARQARGVSY